MYLSCPILAQQQTILLTTSHCQFAIKRDVIIAHTGTNGLIKGVNTVKKVKKVVERIR